MKYTYEYQSHYDGLVSSVEAYSRELAVYHLRHIFSIWCYQPSDIVHHGWGFWTRCGVFLGRIVPCVATDNENEYTIQKS